MKTFTHTVILLLLLSLVSCGLFTEPEPDPQRGEILKQRSLGTYTPEFFEFIASQFDLPFDLTIQYPIDAYRVDYHTIGVDGKGTTASGLVLRPRGPESLDVRSVQHGTEIKRTSAGSRNPLAYGFEALLAAGQGYLVSAPDYLGLGSSEDVHPYLHYETSGTSVMDMLTATYAMAADSAWPVTDRLFLSGYSGGGYVTMAAQRYLEEDEPGVFTPTAVAPMAGPYDIPATANAALENLDYPFPALLALVIYSFDEVYGWNRLGEIFKPPYDTSIPQLFDGSYSVTEAADSLPPAISDLVYQTFIDGLLDGSETQVLEVMEANSLLEDWTPQAPVRLFHGTADQIVSIVNSENALEAFRGRGAEIDLVRIHGADHLEAVFPSILLADVWFDSLRLSDQ